MKVLVAGDFAPSGRVSTLIREKRFAEVFPKDICDAIKSADFSFVNFESPIAEDSYVPISKCGPNLCCSEEFAEAIKYAGFTGVTMANNHILDYGADGLLKSINCCKEQGLDVLGAGRNIKEASNVLYLDSEGQRLAVINCCEHEFSIADDFHAGANPLNAVRQYYAIQQARKQSTYVLVIVHGGHEQYNLPSPRMQEIYRFFIDVGADAVLNHHQHCYSGYELYHNKPIFYGLGNFCFDESIFRNSNWNEGYLVILEFDHGVVGYKLVPYTQCNEYPHVELVADRASFDKQIEEINSIINDSVRLEDASKRYYSTCVNYFDSILQPYDNRILKKLYRMRLLPSLISKKKYLSILNRIDCESHRDKFIFAIKQLIEKRNSSR